MEPAYRSIHHLAHRRLGAAPKGRAQYIPKKPSGRGLLSRATHEIDENGIEYQKKWGGHYSTPP